VHRAYDLAIATGYIFAGELSSLCVFLHLFAHVYIDMPMAAYVNTLWEQQKKFKLSALTLDTPLSLILSLFSIVISQLCHINQRVIYCNFHTK
jgi:membrane-bound metal-dependent hydrolase YbcI (DUF457 family)